MAFQGFEILRGTVVIADTDTTVTITEGIDYTLNENATTSNSFIRITNTMKLGMGRTSGGGGYAGHRIGATINNPSNLLTSITFERDSALAAYDSRIDYEIIQFVDPVDTTNSIVVRDVGEISVGATDLTGDSSAISTISDENDVVVFITGQRNGAGDATRWNRALFTSALIPSGGDHLARFTRGLSGSSQTSDVSYAIVEFTGSNWRNIQRLEFTQDQIGATTWDPASPNNEGTASITALGGVSLLDISKTFSHNQFRQAAASASPQEINDVIYISGVNELTQKRRTSAEETNITNVIWLIENTQASGSLNNLRVQHVQHYQTAGVSEEESIAVTITAVDDITESSVMGLSSSTEGTAGFPPRGSVNVRLTGTTTVTLTRSDSGEEEWISFQVVQWPETPSQAITVPLVDSSAVINNPLNIVNLGNVEEELIDLVADDIEVNLWS